MMYTYQFRFRNPNTNKMDETQICAESMDDAVEEFQEFCLEELFDDVPKYRTEIVYSEDDANYYGEDYGW